MRHKLWMRDTHIYDDDARLHIKAKNDLIEWSTICIAAKFLHVLFLLNCEWTDGRTAI